MAKRFSRTRLLAHLKACDDARIPATKGRAFETLVKYLFECVPGIAISERNVVDQFRSEEIDLAFWNDQLSTGLTFLPRIFLVEVKNWTQPVGSSEVTVFAQKLRSRRQFFGILVAANGITGDAVQRTSAHRIIEECLAEDRQILVISRDDIESINAMGDLFLLLKKKILKLVVSGTSI